MHIRLIAVGDRQPSWVDSAFSDYSGRLPKHWRFRLESIPTTPRKNSSGDSARLAEGRKILDILKPADFVVLLDERGTALSSRDLSSRLNDWQTAGRNLSFIIGGPDGVSTDCSERADYAISLSKMTLPHGLARVMFAEQLYRAWSLTQGHPYHRD